MSAYLTADLTGWEAAVFWLGIGLLGVAIALAFARLVGWVCDNWPGDLNDPNDFGADDNRVPKE